jgi:SEC-C motif-containing protein
MTSTTRCPCGSGDTCAACCGRLHAGAVSAPTAVTLMRSRFSAFAMADADYLYRTWHSSTRPQHVQLDEELTWTHLEIVETVGGGLFDTTGTVEFRAHYRSTDGRGVVHERSNFVCEAGQWFYVDGELNPH